MSEHVTVRQLSHATQQAQEWLNDLAGRTSFDGPAEAYSFLRAVLHALRDRLTVEEAAHFGQQLPMMVRGFYFEGWRPAMAPNDFETPEELYAQVQKSLGGLPSPSAPSISEATRTVLEFLEEHCDPGQMRHVRTQLPDRIVDEVFPQPVEA